MNRSLRVGLMSGAVVFAAFLANAMLHPQEYRCHASVDLEFGNPLFEKRASSHPLEVVRRLREGVLTAEFRAKLGTEFTPMGDGSPTLQSVDGRILLVSAQHRDRSVAARLCKSVAEHVANRAPEVLAQPPSPSVSGQVVIRSAEALAAFAARHPAVVASAASAPELAEQWRALLRQAAGVSSAAAGETKTAPTVLRAQPRPVVVDKTPADARQRSLLLLVGLIAAVGTGLAAALARAATDVGIGLDPWLDAPSESDAPEPALQSDAPSESDAPEPALQSDAPLASTEASRSDAPSAAPVRMTPVLAITAPASPVTAADTGSIQANPLITILPPPLAVDAQPAQAIPAPVPAPAPSTERMPRAPSEDAPSTEGPEYVVAELSVATRSSSTAIPVARTTRALGSPIPPADPEAIREQMALRRTAILGSPYPPRDESARVTEAIGTPEGSSGSGRYSFIRTPPPGPPGPPVPVRQKDVTAGFHPDPSLRPSACAALRRELYSLGVERCFVVGVTSSSDCQEEKARFTAELALLLAQSGHARVLLIEADFHRPRLHRVLRVEPPEGQSLSEQMHGSASERAVEGWTVLRCLRSLHVLLQGERGTPGLNLSRRFAECIRDVRMHYDFILLDGPAEDSIEDLRALAAFVDGALIVGRAAAQQDLERLAELFSGKKLLKAVRPT